MQGWILKVWTLYIQFLRGRKLNGTNDGLPIVIKLGLNGKHSIYTEWNNVEIMFHCLTYLPYVPNDKLQVRRSYFSYSSSIWN